MVLLFRVVVFSRQVGGIGAVVVIVVLRFVIDIVIEGGISDEKRGGVVNGGKNEREIKT